MLHVTGCLQAEGTVHSDRVAQMKWICGIKYTFFMLTNRESERERAKRTRQYLLAFTSQIFG